MTPYFAPIDLATIDNWTKAIPRGQVCDRDAIICDLARGKRVLHLGATDAPFHQAKARRQELLHQKLRSICGSIVGIDSDAEAVAWLQTQHGIDDIMIADVTMPGMTIPGAPFDLVLCCDIIEHVVDLSALIAICRSNMGPDTELLVTTINATALKPAMRALVGRESVHPDHVMYFSVWTLAQLLRRQQLRPVGAAFFAYTTRSALMGRLTRWLFKRAPGCADGIMVTARLG